MSEQIKKNKQEAAPQEEVEEDTLEAKDQTELDEDIDSILDEIDDVLETNAQEFVSQFIQKGGE